MNKRLKCDGAGEIEKNIWRGEEGMQIEMDVMVTCSECNGTGRVHFSCCGDDVSGTIYEDYNLCPTCKEHLPGEEDCENCEGKGTILEQIKALNSIWPNKTEYMIRRLMRIYKYKRFPNFKYYCKLKMYDT